MSSGQMLLTIKEYHDHLVRLFKVVKPSNPLSLQVEHFIFALFCGTTTIISNGKKHSDSFVHEKSNVTLDFNHGSLYPNYIFL